MGGLQRDFLVDQGLMPEHRLLDVGCGALRAGIHLVEYLDPGHYYGIDINETVLDAGYDRELPAALRARLPRDHLRETERFDCDFGVLRLRHRAIRLHPHIAQPHPALPLPGRPADRTGGRFFATFFEARPRHPLDQSLQESAVD